MKALYTYKDSQRTVNVWVEQYGDGTSGPPKRFAVSERSGCAFAPAVEIQLELQNFDVELNMANYRVLD